ncbi:MAG: gliding motility-associated ABC transporter ATP-binding subunit GldA [Chitinophagales bacterium]|nr:gliding motility-associated ABC transporter ATP-binding subunit GldA [Chitinophagales bacterium]
MSIVISGLSKIYGKQKAIDSISLQVQPGDVLGFLGPNGAGKSTTMKILAGFIPPTSGKAVVCDYDVEIQSIQARRNIGYLPENNPLYTDMFVIEYLQFSAKLNGLNHNREKRIREMVHLTGLAKEKHKKIHSLSKGFRQRVGLAQALLHDPKVLIMDEPTSGLDPNQLVDVRELIKELGKEKTVMLSTHIMQEVEAICNRIIIIHQGKIVADNKLTELSLQTRNETTVIVSFKQNASQDQLKGISGVSGIENLNSGKWKLTGDMELQEKVFQFAVNNQLIITSLVEEKSSLEDVFREITKEN